MRDVYANRARSCVRECWHRVMSYLVLETQAQISEKSLGKLRLVSLRSA